MTWNFDGNFQPSSSFWWQKTAVLTRMQFSYEELILFILYLRAWGRRVVTNCLVWHREKQLKKGQCTERVDGLCCVIMGVQPLSQPWEAPSCPMCELVHTQPPRGQTLTHLHTQNEPPISRSAGHWQEWSLSAKAGSSPPFTLRTANFTENQTPFGLQSLYKVILLLKAWFQNK